MSARETDEQLIDLIRRESRDKCLAFFAGMDAGERRGYSAPALDTYRDLEQAWLNRSGAQEKPLPGRPLREQLDNASVSVLCTATAGELKKLGLRIVPGDGYIVDVIRELQPDWINQWVQDLSESAPRSYHDIRLLYEAGLCDKPTGEGYILGMIEGLPGWRIAPSSLWDKDTPLAERIRRSSDIKEDDVWRLFQVEGSGDLSLAAFDKYIAPKIGGWSAALVELSADGTLSRNRLLDESLNALERDFAQFRAGWFSRFHEALQPTLEERAARREKYLRLIGSAIAPTVSFALKAVLLLDKAKVLPPGDLLAHIEPALQARSKGTVKSALRLIATAAKRAPDASAAACAMAAAALIHEAADVQEKALDLIETLGGVNVEQVVATMSAYTDGIAPSLCVRFTQMVGEAGDAVTVERAHPPDATAPVMDVEPIASFEELNLELLKALEDASQPLRVERVLDGIARFGSEKPRDFDKLAGPLRKRAAAIVRRQSDDELQYQLARLAYAFASSEALRDDDSIRYPRVDIAPYSAGSDRERRSFEDVFTRRNMELLAQVREGHGLPLLSAPTDSRGYIAPQALLTRYSEYKSRGVTPGPVDAALALLRLSPDARDLASKTLIPGDEFEHAVAFALGSDAPPGETDWLWVAAAGARIPYVEQPGVAKKHGRGFPDAGTPARYSTDFESNAYFTSLHLSVEPKISKPVPAAFLPTTFHLTSAGDNQYGSVCGTHVNMIRWCSTVWPLNSEPFFSQGLLVFDHDQRLANSPYVGFLEPMLERHVPVGPMGCVLLALGLASSDPAVKGVALEAAIASISEDRLSLERMCDALAVLIPSGYAPVGRWTKSLSELSAVSMKHTRLVQALIEGSLRHDPSRPPRDIGGLIELLYELSVAADVPVSGQESLDYLRGVSGGGKLKRFAGKLLARAD